MDGQTRDPLRSVNLFVWQCVLLLVHESLAYKPNLSSFLRNVLSTIADDSQFRLVTPCFLDVYQYTTVLEYYL